MFKILRTGLRLIPTAIHAKKKITNLIKGNKKKNKRFDDVLQDQINDLKSQKSRIEDIH